MRKKQAVQTPAEEKLDFSKSLQKLKPESFFRFIGEYPAKEGTSTYVYRVLPKIDRELAGIHTTNIDISTAPLDEDYLLRKHGSGRYHLKFSDANRPRGLTEVAKTTVEVWDPMVDPIINPVELLVSAPENDVWVRKFLSRGWTVEDGKLQQPASGSDAGVLAKTVSDMAERMAARPAESETATALVNRALDVLSRENRGRGDELERAFQIAERLRPAADPAQVQLLKLLTDIATDRARPAEQPNPLSQLKETAAFLRELGFGRGGQAAPPAGSSWQDLGIALLTYGPQILAQFAAMRGPNVVGMPPGPAAAAVPGSVPANGGDVLNPMDLNAMMEVGRDALDAFERGIDGDDFAHALVCRNRAGEQLYVKLSSMGKDGVLSALSMVPGLAQQLAPRRAELETWLESFMKYGQEPGDAQPGTKVA